MIKSKLHLPILPLQDIVFFPHTVIPITLENPAAIRIIKDCLEFNTPVAMPLVDGYSMFEPGSPRRIGSIGIPIVLEEGPGFLRVLISGIGKVKLLNPVQEIPYAIYEAEVLYDTDEKKYPNFKEDSDKLTFMLKEWINENVIEASERQSFLANLNTINQTLDYICMFLLNDNDVKQHILETQSFNARMKLIKMLFSKYDANILDYKALGIIKEYQSIELTAKVFH
ncbi:MAG: LON peptidase substrate-binding domain-containing protein [Bdellovibrionales bacterium]|nr:LON peptidase substrate-binding domain-containing protein [Bdellovibrionales bacterium]